MNSTAENDSKSCGEARGNVRVQFETRHARLDLVEEKGSGDTCFWLKYDERHLPAGTEEGPTAVALVSTRSPPECRMFEEGITGPWISTGVVLADRPDTDDLVEIQFILRGTEIHLETTHEDKKITYSVGHYQETGYWGIERGVELRFDPITSSLAFLTLDTDRDRRMVKLRVAPAALTRAPCISQCKDCRVVAMTEQFESNKRRTELENYVAMDCEMVYVQDPGTGDKMLALGRVSIVDHVGEVLLDTFVQPLHPIVDYATHLSGLRKEDIDSGLPFLQVQQMVANLIQDKVVVVHDGRNDFEVLGLSHPAQMQRDTSNDDRLIRRADPRWRHPRIKLKVLALRLLGRRIQMGSHCSVVDARATMDVYLLVHDG